MRLLVIFVFVTRFASLDAPICHNMTCYGDQKLYAKILFNRCEIKTVKYIWITKQTMEMTAVFRCTFSFEVNKIYRTKWRFNAKKMTHNFHDTHFRITERLLYLRMNYLKIKMPPQHATQKYWQRYSKTRTHLH